MTEQQIEAAARKLCEIRGVNPDARVAHGAPPNENGIVHAVLVYSPYWRVVAREVLSFYQVAQAVDSVIGNGELS